MKKILWVLAGLLFLNNADAQDKDSVVTLPMVTVRSGTRVSDQLEKAFEKAFPNAEERQWYKMEKHYLASFMEDDMKTNALFRKNGWLDYYISFGSRDNLPVVVRNQVQQTYKDCVITRAVRVKSEDRDLWIVNLEGMKNFYLVRAEEGELVEVEKLDKSG